MNKGFTLLEVTVTLLIVSILATFCVVLYQGPSDQADAVAAKAALFSVANALEEYHGRYQSYEGFRMREIPDATLKKYTLRIESVSRTQFLIVAKQQPGGETIYMDQDGNLTGSCK